MAGCGGHAQRTRERRGAAGEVARPGCGGCGGTMRERRGRQRSSCCAIPDRSRFPMALRGSGIMVLPAADESAMTRKTILNDAHRALSAKMVDFGGWDMPLNYGSQIEENRSEERRGGKEGVSSCRSRWLSSH